MFRDYGSPEYKKFRQKIKQLDQHKCQWPGCGATKKLQVHHIKKWSEYPGLRFHEFNGITLCKTHHQFIKNNEDHYAEMFFKIVSNRRTS